ncbi:sulfurtransferase TusA family protein [Ectobacillus polymachus]|uniref:sulfurtransferase TusA family protein n=1 Tax=Ectobacillus polymachus TaxID=1508806 RepID=UPI003A85C96F
MKSDKILDATSLSCPMPVVQTKRMIDRMESGQILEIHATDKGSKKDIPAWVQATGHTLLHQEDNGEMFKYWIQKA